VRATVLGVLLLVGCTDAQTPTEFEISIPETPSVGKKSRSLRRRLDWKELHRAGNRRGRRIPSAPGRREMAREGNNKVVVKKMPSNISLERTRGR
jgi:hypothetical protein